MHVLVIYIHIGPAASILYAVCKRHACLQHDMVKIKFVLRRPVMCLILATQ